MRKNEEVINRSSLVSFRCYSELGAFRARRVDRKNRARPVSWSHQNSAAQSKKEKKGSGPVAGIEIARQMEGMNSKSDSDCHKRSGRDW